MADEVLLRVAGNIYSGWQSAEILRSIEQGPHEFKLTVVNAWRTSGHRHIQDGDVCRVSIDNDLVITGFVDEHAPDYDATSQTLNISGRSKLGDLVDASLLDQEYNNQSLDAIARAECEPFGINVIVATDVGAAFKRVRRDAGQSPWEFLDGLARVRAVRLVSDAEGNLIIARAGTRLAAVGLKLGANIEKASANFSCRERFSDYIVVGKNGDTDFDDAEQTAHVMAKAKDAGVRRYRPVVIVADNDGRQMDCQAHADWQRNTHYGRGRGIVYTVRGWREKTGGQIWEPNTRVRVDDDYMNIHGELIIVEVRLTIDRDGKISQLRVMPREAIERTPLPEPKVDGSDV